jgi:hypothetical protein
MNSYVGFLTNQGFIVPVVTLRARLGDAYNKLLAKLTITHHQKIGPPKVAKLYSFIHLKGIECIVLPRTSIKTLGVKTITVQNLLPALRPITATLNFEPYANQQLVIEYLLSNVFTPERVANGTACALLNMRAGMGKTYVGGATIPRIGVRTLYVVPTRPLAIQTVRELRACLYPDVGTPTALVGMYGKYSKKAKLLDPSAEEANRAVTVIVINSALNCDSSFFAGYSAVIFDEVHAYCTQARREIFKKASLPIMFGMSATTEERKDGFDPVAHKELAFDNIIRAENISGFTYEDVKFDITAKCIYYCGPAEYTQNLKHESTDLIFTHYMHNQFISDPHRLKLAVNELIKLYDWSQGAKQHNIYIFAEEVKILIKARDAICAALVARHRDDIVKNIGLEVNDETENTQNTLRMFTGGLKDAEVTNIVQNARVLFSTYAYAGTGVSIQKMTAMMFLTPRKANMKQIIPRILRRGSDLAIPRIIVDIIDNKTSLKYQFGARNAAYDFYGCKKEEVRIKYSD